MNARISPLAAIADLVFLGVLIAAGALAGAATGHAIGTGVVLCEYGGASMFVGFGLVNRMVRGSMFRVVGPIGFCITLVFAVAVGYFALPGVVLWRCWRVVASIRRGTALWRAYTNHSTIAA